MGAYVHEVWRARMSQTINSKVAARVGLTERDLPGSALTALESSPGLDLCTLSVVTVACRSLAELEIRAVADEETALRYALSLLRSAHSALDTAS